MYDIVYVFRKGPIDSVELRYSLRSLENIPHNKVFIVGYLPKRIQNVEHIYAEDKTGSKYHNVINKYKLICSDRRISKDFILMNDDIYAIKQVKTVPYYTRGTLKDLAEHIYTKHGESKYYNIIDRTLQVYPEGMSYNVHCPIIYNKEKLRKILKKYGDEEISIRSLYGNMFNVDNEPYKGNDRLDCKVFGRDSNLNFDQEYLSSNDDAVNNKEFIDYMSKKFPHKSIYEKNFLSITKQIMLFKAKPKYSVSLSRLVQFDAQGNYQTDDMVLASELMKLESVTLVDNNQEIEADVLPTETTDGAVAELDIAKLREQYKEKFNKKCYGGRTAEQIQQKLAE